LFYSQRNSRPEASLELAREIGSRLVQAGFTPTQHHAEQIPGEGRALVAAALGVYRFDELSILAGATVPAVLLECGVIVHPDEEKLLRDPTYRSRLVEAVSLGIETFSQGSSWR